MADFTGSLSRIRKEAYFKGVGDGIKGTFKTVSIIPESKELRSFRINLPNSPTDQFAWTIIPIEVPPGYHAALAFEGSINDQFRYEFTPENYLRACL